MIDQGIEVLSLAKARDFVSSPKPPDRPWGHPVSC